MKIFINTIIVLGGFAVISISAWFFAIYGATKGWWDIKK